MLEDLHADAAEASKQILVVANTILKTLNQPYALDNIDYHNTPSIGITLFNDHETTIEEQLKHADLAMYQAKASGRNTLCFFDPVSQSAVEDRSELETALRLALRDDLLELHYQAQIDRSGNLVGAEALVSWEHPERGTLGAQALRTLTDATGLGHPLGLKTLELACAQLASWAQDPQLANTSMAVHVSANLFGHHDFVPHLRAQLTRHKVHPALLKLELPESLLLSDPVKFSSKMTELSNLGVTFSLHNFGTGYATLAHLEILPLVQLKIAPDFVRDLLTDQNDAAMVRAIIAMGHSLGLEVVAEGVDTEAQWTCLMREGCDVGQGAWFSQPVPSGTFRKTHGAIR
jgi:EAL domain-containing protein (putative c-di-GMP-specific phosphodiesterase class I)